MVQIHSECKRFGKVYGLRSVAVYGGGSMWEQAKALQEGAEIIVCTPVRTSHFQYTTHQTEMYSFVQMIRDKRTFLLALTGSSNRSCKEEGHISAASHLPGI